MRPAGQKLKSQRGVTLVEALAAVAILSVFSVVVYTGLQMAFRSYDTMQAETETQTLLSTLVEVISDQLRYARDVETDPGGVLTSYTSATLGAAESLTVTQGRLTEKNGQSFLPSGAYGNGDYTICRMDITYENGVFTLSLAVTNGQGVTAEVDALAIQCLNG